MRRRRAHETIPFGFVSCLIVVGFDVINSYFLLCGLCRNCAGDRECIENLAMTDYNARVLCVFVCDLHTNVNVSCNVTDNLLLRMTDKILLV